MCAPDGQKQGLLSKDVIVGIRAGGLHAFYLALGGLACAQSRTSLDTWLFGDLLSISNTVKYDYSQKHPLHCLPAAILAASYGGKRRHSFRWYWPRPRSAAYSGVGTNRSTDFGGVD